MIARWGGALWLVVVMGACGRPEPAADSTAALPVDTMKPAVVDATADSIARADSMRAADSAKAAGATPPPSAESGSRRQTKTDSLSPNIGRDSVIKPKGRLPAMDTTRRP